MSLDVQLSLIVTIGDLISDFILYMIGYQDSYFLNDMVSNHIEDKKIQQATNNVSLSIRLYTSNPNSLILFLIGHVSDKFEDQ